MVSSDLYIYTLSFNKHKHTYVHTHTHVRAHTHTETERETETETACFLMGMRTLCTDCYYPLALPTLPKYLVIWIIFKEVALGQKD